LEITLLTGPMFSGKSTALVQRMEKYLYANKKIILVRPHKDDRGYLTHSGFGLKNKFEQLIAIEYMSEITEEDCRRWDSSDASALFIDEYFMIKNCKNLVHMKNIDIYLAGLLATSEGTLFDEARDILPFCTSIKLLKAVCSKCGKEANMSGYIGQTKKTEDVVVDTNDDLYKPLCITCWQELNESKKNQLSLLDNSN